MSNSIYDMATPEQQREAARRQHLSGVGDEQYEWYLNEVLNEDIVRGCDELEERRIERNARRRERRRALKAEKK